MRVLVVEDDPISLKMLSAAVTRLGHEVSTAVDGAHGWEVYQRVRPNLVLTDWMMPTVDGLELCRKIRAEGEGEQPHLVLVTTLSGRERMLDGFRAGADDYFAKPVDLEVLASKLTAIARVARGLADVNERTLRTVVQTCQTVVGHDNLSLMESLGQLVTLHREQRAFAKARAFLRRQVGIAEANGDAETASRLRGSLAEIQDLEDASIALEA